MLMVPFSKIDFFVCIINYFIVILIVFKFNRFCNIKIIVIVYYFLDRNFPCKVIFFPIIPPFFYKRMTDKNWSALPAWLPYQLQGKKMFLWKGHGVEGHGVASSLLTCIDI